MTHVAALDVLLNGEHLGTVSLCTCTTWHVCDGEVRSDTAEEAVKGAICLVCFLRDDDLLKTHRIDEFTVKGTTMRRVDVPTGTWERAH